MIIPHAKPGTASKNKTGSWRDQEPDINKNKCIKCGMCATHCPEGAIEITKDGAEVNYDYCKGCGICAEVCPVKAITMRKIKK
ncbi:4Fe-4S binding protein [Candidatus Micrarchaeota archaeon]|nr:4Fe-4S binding protein [Candidatus Micrarchaeota archaeon]